MQDFLPAMRLIKMYAWEPQFARLVALARGREVSKIRAAAMLTSFNHGLFYVMNKSIVFALLTCWLLSGGRLSAQLVFVASTLNGKMAIIMGLYLPLFVQQVAHCQVAIRRLYSYLTLPEQNRSTARYQAKQQSHPFATLSVPIAPNAPALIISTVPKDENQNRFFTNVVHKAGNRKLRACFQNVSACYEKPLDKQNIANDDKKQAIIPNSEQILCDMNLELHDAQLTVVVGSVGAGKSSLLLCALNELHLLRGQVRVDGCISYAAQEPWIFTGSVRENIIFGSPFCRQRYLRVLKVCALKRDLRLFPYADRTMVGERGVSLSGGQRARISFARALYRQADIYLLDDPLSAVDAHVAKHLFAKAIRSFLRDRCVVLVTHQLQVVTEGERLVLMRSGRVQLQGPMDSTFGRVLCEEEFSQLKVSLGQSGRDADKINDRYEEEAPQSGEEKERSDEETDSETEDDQWAAELGLFDDLNMQTNLVANLKSSDARKDVENCLTTNPSDTVAHIPVVAQENNELSATWKAYRVYLRLGLNRWFAPLLGVVFVGTQSLYTLVDFWMSLWTDSEERRGLYEQRLVDDRRWLSNATRTDRPPIEFERKTFVDDFDREQNLFFYALQMSLLFVLSFFRAVLFFLMCMRASVRLHDRLFERVIRAPIAFFDRNPVGILLNRVSRDLGKFDFDDTLATLLIHRPFPHRHCGRKHAGPPFRRL